MSFEAKVKELDITLPTVNPGATRFAPAVSTGNLVYVSGQTPMVDGKFTFIGKLGRDYTVEQGREAAKICTINCLAAVRHITGSLDKIVRIVKVNGYVASAEGFTDQPLVMNAATELLLELFGDAGLHARAAVGVAELPSGVAVEVEMIVEVQP